MNTVPTPRREMFKYIEQIQAELIDGLGEPTVQQELGSLAVDLKSLTEGLFVPNVRRGAVSLPKAYSGVAGTPVIALKEGETVRRKKNISHLSPGQIKYLDNNKNELSDPDLRDIDTVSFIRNNKRAIKEAYPTNRKGFPLYPLGPNVLGRAVCSSFSIGESPYSYGCMPLVILKLLPQPLSSEMLAHELVHVKKREEMQPYSHKNDEDVTWREELEAYNASARYGEKIIALGSERFSGSGLGVSLPVENYRKLLEPDDRDPFFPHPAIKARFPYLVG